MDDSLLSGLQESSTAAERQQALQYFEHLKSKADGWKLCTTHFTQRIHSDPHVKFFCLQVLEYHVKHRHVSSSDDDILALHKCLLTWMQPTEKAVDVAPFIKNKMAQIYALVFVVDYPSKWPHFFATLLECVQSAHIWSVDLYLRVLLAIDSELVDRQVVHCQEENVRNTAIKDTMREQCVPDLVESFLQIMLKFHELNCPLVCLAMEVVGAYVSWIDIMLIANDRFINLLLMYLSNPDLRESSTECLHEIIGKGMEPVAKTKLIEALYKMLVSIGVLSAGNVKSDDEADFQVKLSKLVSGMGCGLIASWNKMVKSNHEYKDITSAAIESKLSYLHRYLCDDDDGVSEAIVPFAVQYIGMLKRHSNLSDIDRTNLRSLLDAVITKLKYDESYDFESEGEEEIMFLEFRKQLKVLLDAIAQVDPCLVLQTSQNWLSSVLANVSSLPFTNVELVLRLFYMLGEVVTDKQYGAVNIPGSSWHQMMCIILQSQVSLYPHTAVIQQYYEVLVRYEKFFLVETSYIGPVMATFLSAHGLRHPNSSLRSRLSYLLVRFIKAMKGVINVFAEQVLENLRELLLMLPGSENYKVYFSNNDMNFLYEAASILIISSPQPPQGKGILMKSIVSPVAKQFPTLLAKLVTTEDTKQQEDIGQALYGLLSFASRASKSFANHTQVLQSGCLECFSEILPVFLRGLEVNVQRDVLHSGVRQYLHRMIICLGDELFSYVPLAVSLLLKDCKARDIQEFIPLINQLIVKYKDRLLPVLEKIFMPVCGSIIALLNVPFDAEDLEEQRDRNSLQKSYFLFISSTVSNNLHTVISNQSSEKVQELLNVLIQNAVEFPDPAVQRICFGVVKKLVDIWGCQGVLTGFVEYMYGHIFPACFLAPSKAGFDLNDGQSYLVLGEIAGILKTAFNRRGEEVLLNLQRYLSSIHFPPDFIEDLLLKMKSSDVKTLRSSLKTYFMRLRTS